MVSLQGNRILWTNPIIALRLQVTFFSFLKNAEISPAECVGHISLTSSLCSLDQLNFTPPPRLQPVVWLHLTFSQFSYFRDCL